MKKWRFALVLGALLALLSATAFAADYGSCADTLHSLGLFQGTGSGYALDQKADRAQAATLFVRLLGGEKEALSSGYACPFTDVPGWAKPYVSYLYQKGLTKGASATTFSSSADCDASMYCTFMLRALGYAEGTDFTYDKAVDVAKSLGIVDGYVTRAPFLRDNLAAISYNMLSAFPKGGGSADLLSRLVSDGAVPADKAKDTLATFAAYRSYLAQEAKMEDIHAVKLTSDAATNITAMGVTTANRVRETSSMSFQSTQPLDLILASSIQDLGAGDSYDMYYKDGWTYLSSSAGKYKYQTDLNQYGDKAEALGMENNPLYTISSMSRKDTSEGTLYSMTLAPGAMNSYLESLAGSMGDYQNLAISQMSLTYLIKEDGTPVSCNVNYDMSMGLKTGGGAVTVKVTGRQTVTFVAFNDDVTVTLPPDLDSYLTREEE